MAIVNIILELFSIMISVILLICLLLSVDRKTRLNRLFVCMISLNILILLSDAATWYFTGFLGPYNQMIILAGNFCVYALAYIILAVFTDYLVTYISEHAKISRKIVYIVDIICIVAISLVIISQFNDLYYSLDDNGQYYRSDSYWLSQVWGIAMILIGMGVTIRYRKSLGRADTVVLLSYGVLPVIAMLIQINFYGLSLLYAEATLSLLIIYVSIQVQLGKKFKEQELELMDSKISIMLSQIQPHFLYNTLTAIRQLCDVDVAQAKDAIYEFSRFLRANMDSLTSPRPIPFKEELSHVKNYLALEKRRFGDRLNVLYEIHFSDFLVPALTLQPIVENAVRHGVTKREQGGTIVLQTKKKDNAFIITVSDDGIGFDSKRAITDGHAHIGIKNVGTRLYRQCGGVIDIASTPGKGTTVTITIPY